MMSARSMEDEAVALPQGNATDAHDIGTVMYLAYGGRDYVDEAIFSLLTAAYFEPFKTGRVRYLVYTDQPEAFASLEGVVVVRIDDHTLREWLGGGDYVHRRKLMSIVTALEACRGKLAFIDTDTYFRKSPAHLFDRIGPGRSCLHLLENILGLSRSSHSRKIRDSLARQPFHWADGSKALPGTQSEMWNSGVIGLDYSDITVIREALRLSDQIWSDTRKHNCEQFAVGAAAGRMTSISPAWDIVYHYWPKFLKRSFRSQLQQSLAAMSALPVHLRPEAAFRSQPRATVLQRVKLLKQPAKYGVARIGRSAYAVAHHLR